MILGRAKSSGIRLTEFDTSLTKGLEPIGHLRLASSK